MKKTCPGGTRKCNSQLSAVDNDAGLEINFFVREPAGD